MATTEFQGEIKVAARIIDHLSSGLYHSPAACLKELVNNSYDADARRVEIFVKPDADRIIIEDNGDGMDREDFEKHFKHVSESHKRDSSETTRSGRPVIGKIGIGFVAANEICDELEIFSTKAGSKDRLHVTINFAEMREPVEKRRRGDRELAKADYHGVVEEAEQREHYTRIFLRAIRSQAREVLAGAKPQSPAQRNPRSLYGLRKESVRARLRDPYLKSWKDLDRYSETMLGVALNVPIQYHKGWLPDRLRRHVANLEDDVSRLNFRVFYDGSELAKPTVLDPHDHKCFVERFEHSGEHVAATGYFYVQHGTIRPDDLQGLLLRVRHAAVGEYDGSFWDFPTSEGALFQNWISAEIWADDRLEEAMNIDRRTLRIVHPAYVELQTAIHQHLRKVLRKARTELYATGSADRRTKKLRAAQRDFREFTSKLPPKVKARVQTALPRVTAVRRESDSDFLLRKLTVLEFFQVVIEAGQGVLTPKQLADLLERLASVLKEQ